ncbi:FAD-dependent oxidoreductase [Chloroflexota bacterium]
MKVNREDFTVPPCIEACPVGLDIPRYIRYIKAGNYDEALAVIRERLPFPIVCADACLAPCEDVCSYRQFGDPIAIRALKRVAVDHGSNSWRSNLKLAPKTDKKIAIVGTGPAGLTAAYYLGILGHSITLYDSLPNPGGIMRYGIPRYRISEERLDKDINEIFDIGVKFKSDITIGKDISLIALIQENDAVFLATGANKSANIGIEGIDKPGVLWALELLRDFALGRQFAFKGDVLVVGGGNVAIDAALTVKRLGANKVSIVCLESRGNMPAHEWEIARAIEEGVDIYNCWGPKTVMGNSVVTGLELIKCTSVIDEAGKFNPIYDPTVCNTINAQYIIIAIGQTSDLVFLENNAEIELTSGTIKVDIATLSTSKPGIFAGGDVVSGSASIVQAIAHGQKAAIAVDKYLDGRGEIFQELITPEIHISLPEFTGEVKPRVEMPLLDLENRDNSFKQIEQGYIVKAVDDLGLEIGDVIWATSIGCAGRQTFAMWKGDNFAGTHGRIYAMASGLTLALPPEKKIICIVGDGDAFGIGLLHLLNAARRNVDVTIIVCDNLGYQSTGGQYSWVTPTGSVTDSSPYGMFEPNWIQDGRDVLNIIKEAGATFLARHVSMDGASGVESIKKALLNKGLSVVHVVYPCPTNYANTALGSRNQVNIFRWIKNSATQLNEKPNDNTIWRTGIHYDAINSRLDFATIVKNKVRDIQKGLVQ